MGFPNPLGILQNVLATGKSLISHVQQKVEVYSTPATVYFHLDLLETERSAQPEGMISGRTQVVLDAGRVYIVRASAVPYSDEITSRRDLVVSGGIEFFLTCEHPAIRIESAQCVTDSSHVDGFVHDFQIKVASDYVSSDAMFQFAYRRNGSCCRPAILAELTLSGTNSIAENNLPARGITLDAQLAPQVRILHVLIAGSDKLELCCYWNDYREISRIVNKPEKSLAEFIEQDIRPRDIVARMLESATDDPEFIRWVKGNLKNHGARFCLVVYDDADSDLAWEMIPVRFLPNDGIPRPADLGEEIPLGALVSVTRWIPRLLWGDTYLQLRVGEELVRGSVVSYIDNSISHADAEVQALSRFETKECNGIEELPRCLANSRSNVALVYLASHGAIVEGEDEQQTFELRFANSVERIRVHSFELLPFVGEHELRPILIVNACHSGWVFKHGDRRRGLPLVFLRRIARGFLGTIGPVSSKYAAPIAQSLLDEIHESENGVYIADALRQLRADAMRRLQEDRDNDDNWFNYVFTLMYIYYGNPFTRLQLLPMQSSNQDGVHQ